MKHKLLFLGSIIFTCFTVLLFTAERSIPVDMILMIDKSLSMAEQGRFENLQLWLEDHFANRILIVGDWVSIFQFYEKPEKLLELTIESNSDIQKIIKTVENIKPDGSFTDIGLALDAIKEEIKPRLHNGRYKIMLLLTDLKQEAPWTSRYAGVQKTFQSPYLIESRIIEHHNWYEITLDMDIKDQVIETTKQLYSTIINIPSERITFENGPEQSYLEDYTSIENSTDLQNDLQTSLFKSKSLDTTQEDLTTKSGTKTSSSLMLIILSALVLISILILGVSLLLRNKRRTDTKEEEGQENKHNNL